MAMFKVNDKDNRTTQLDVCQVFLSLTFEHFALFRLLVINPFQVNLPNLYPLKAPEGHKGFLVFSGGIKWEYWSGMSRL